MTTRSTLLAVSALASLLAFAAQSLIGREPADPCDANPEIHACAVFLQPEWQRRSVHAGRSSPIPVPAAAQTESVAATGEATGAVQTPQQDSDGV